MFFHIPEFGVISLNYISLNDISRDDIFLRPPFGFGDSKKPSGDEYDLQYA